MSGLAALEVKYPLLMAQAIVWGIKEGSGHNVTCGKTHETGVHYKYSYTADHWYMSLVVVFHTEGEGRGGGWRCLPQNKKSPPKESHCSLRGSCMLCV